VRTVPLVARPSETSDPIVLDEPGTYDVTCLIHPSMQLTITVE
jgi:plastocyanin